LKAMSRLFDAEEATFTARATPPGRRTRSLARGTVLWMGDTTETDFGIRRAVRGLGPTGEGSGLGVFRHSSMRVDAASGEILGRAGQERFSRQLGPKDENSYQRLQRARASEVWGRVVELVGPPAAGVRFVHVVDRGGDNLEVFCHCRARACKKSCVRLPDGVIPRLPCLWRLTHGRAVDEEGERVGEGVGGQRHDAR
jgi:hypothetical protein